MLSPCSSPVTTPARRDLVFESPLEDSRINAEESGLADGSECSKETPHHSPLLIRNKRRLFQLTQVAENHFANLALETPEKDHAKKLINAKSNFRPQRPVFSRAMTAPGPTHSISYQNESASLSNAPHHPNEQFPPSKLRRLHDAVANGSAEPQSSTSANFPSFSHSGERFSLPNQTSTKDAIKRISASTLYELINGQYDHLVDEYKIFDCRFKYEYDGGHIRNAVNVATHDCLKQAVFPHGLDNHELSERRVVLIFHCEFSQHRGPKMALHLRSQDRIANGCHYPRLYFPEVYVLEGGYQDFFSKYMTLCEPQAYTQMNDLQYRNSLKMEKMLRGGSYVNQPKSIDFGVQSKRISKSFVSSHSAPLDEKRVSPVDLDLDFEAIERDHVSEGFQPMEVCNNSRSLHPPTTLKPTRIDFTSKPMPFSLSKGSVRSWSKRF